MVDTDSLEPIADEGAPQPRPKAAPIESRFLFVDVAAMRAKQLRRGARPRLEELEENGEPQRLPVLKPERVAMEEVRRGYVLYDLPTASGTPAEAP